MTEIVAPVIDTPRLRLRGHRAGDLPACIAMWSDPHVTRFIGGRPSTEQQTWARLLAYVGHWALMGFGYWAIEERRSNEFVGEVGFADFKRDIAASIKDKPELGFALGPRFHGLGYATEGVRAALAWADAYLPYSTTVSLVNPENLASLRVLEKCGYGCPQRIVLMEQPVSAFSRGRNGKRAAAGGTTD
ncbi:MAG TPA: GNAT family N-acetyltransferase [Candidatus Cybelea sp.]|nr:GNAT family N-acetyltransferase [Candidatus Cybelea sp.]